MYHWNTSMHYGDRWENAYESAYLSTCCLTATLQYDSHVVYANTQDKIVQ